MCTCSCVETTPPADSPILDGAPPSQAIVIVRATPAVGVQLADIRAIAERVRSRFVGVAGLQCRFFGYVPDRGEVVNVDVWSDRSRAEQVLTPDFLTSIRAAFGCEPDVTVANVVAVSGTAGTALPISTSPDR